MLGPQDHVKPVDGGAVSPTNSYKDVDDVQLYDSYLNEKQKLDNKNNSRRKSDRPRKRKRESESDDVLESSSTLEDAESTGEVERIESPTTEASTGKTVAQDLSVKTTDLISTETTTSNQDNKWLPPSQQQQQCTTESQTYTNNTTSSVRDLEEVMNKHLPAVTNENDQIRSTYENSSSSSSTDYNYNKHKSPIQWIGSQHTTATETLPATNLLRSLYANRESVIRSNVYNPRPQYYNDVQSSLLTPPATTETYKDNTFHNSTTQLNNKQSPTPYLPYGSNNTIMPESYNITPPASVSPQDKYSTHYGNTNIESCTDAAYRQYTDSLPIKPQAYPLPAHTSSSYERAVQQYSSGSYYGHGGFYNHTPTPAHYHDGTKNGAW